MQMRSTPAGRVVAGRAQSGVGPLVIQHFGALYFAIVFTETDRADAIELAELGAVPALEPTPW